MSSDVSWKAFDVKIAPVLSAWDDAEGTMLGVSLSIVKPITSYLGTGVIIEAGTNSSGCELSNFMFLVNFQDGTVEYTMGNRFLPLVYDKDGNQITDFYTRDDSGDYYHESFMFRSNLGIAWRTSSKRFGLELYPVDFAVTDYDVRVTFSLNAVFRAF